MSTFNDMISFIKSAWPARKYTVPCLVGPAGIGKTAAVKQAANELNAGKVVTIIASQILPNEVSGITMPVVESKAMEIFDHFRLSSLEDGDILFFDELLEADQLVLSACLTLIESRELMSGRKLADVMIVAATNPSIKPNMLKENIRQRFLWREFGLDRSGCRDYIRETCGLDLPVSLTNKLCVTGEEYNILTPRSLTKMCQWMSTATNTFEAERIAKEMDACWNMGIGTELKKVYIKRFYDPMRQAKDALKSVIDTSSELIVNEVDVEQMRKLFDPEAFEQTSLNEIMEILRALPQWSIIEEQLSSMTIEDNEEETVVSF